MEKELVCDQQGKADECDHIVAVIGGVNISQSRWPAAKSEHEAAIHFFNTTRLAVPHPGFEQRCGFCIHCGAKIDETVFSVPVPVFVGTPSFYLNYEKLHQKMGERDD